MFQVAAAIAASATQNRMFAVPDCQWTETLGSIFLGFTSTTLTLPLKDMKTWQKMEERYATDYSPIEVVTKTNISISGYRQSWKYFQTQLEQRAVREMFRFTDYYENHAIETLRNSSKLFGNVQEATFVGIHIRKGDLSSSRFTDYGYQMASSSFYNNAIRMVESHLNKSKSIIYVASSDSPKNASALLRKLSQKHKIAWLHGTAAEDLATLSKCNHTIISGGTFSFWAAWLAGGKTFYFTKFAKEGSRFSEQFNSSNFYLDEWIPVLEDS